MAERKQITGRKSLIGTTAVRLSSTQTDRPNIGTQVLADPNNGDRVYIGFDNAITDDQDDGTDGFPLEPGASILIHDTKPYDLWVKGAVAGPSKVFFIGV